MDGRRAKREVKGDVIFMTKVALIILSLSLIKYYFPDQYKDVNRFLNPSLFYILTLILILGLVIRFRHTLVKLLAIILNLTTNTKIRWVIILLATQLALASTCYWIYIKNPKVFVLADEIQNRYLEIIHANAEKEIKKINGLNDDLISRLKMLKYLRENKSSFIKSSDDKLMVNDSIVIVKELAFHPPGKDQIEMSIKVYTKHNLEFIMFLVAELEPFEVTIENQISLIEDELKVIQNEFDQVKSNSGDNRWGYLHFISYYFKEQLQPMTAMLIVFDFIKLSIWFLLSFSFTIPFLNIKKSAT